MNMLFDVDNAQELSTYKLWSLIGTLSFLLVNLHTLITFIAIDSNDVQASEQEELQSLPGSYELCCL